MSTIPLPNQIKVSPRPVASKGSESTVSPSTETASDASPSQKKPPRKLRPHLTSRLGEEFPEVFKKIGKTAEEAASAIQKFEDQRRADQPKGRNAQAEPHRNQRRSGRRTQRP